MKIVVSIFFYYKVNICGNLYLFKIDIHILKTFGDVMFLLESRQIQIGHYVHEKENLNSFISD